MADKTLYLIRHAEPDFPNGEKICLGQKNDLPLSRAGMAQAGLLNQAFRSIPLETVYTSPLLRARQTADIVAGGRPVHVLDSLIELSGGEWDGLPFASLRETYPQYFTRGTVFSCPPGGESDESGLARALSALHFIEQRTERCAAIVAHSCINRLLLCRLLGRPASEKRQLRHGYAAMAILIHKDGRWQAARTGIAPEDAAAVLSGREDGHD